MSREIHLTRKDFKLDWFSGTGKGGQHRNKHQNCCRITHIETGIAAVGQSARDRQTNQRLAFETLARRIMAYYAELDQPARRISNETIRTYHAERNEVIDKASGIRLPYKQVVEKGDIGPMIEARKNAQP